jgi:hypothetical protein
MNSTPKTIQIFLPGGDPRGVRIAEITTRIVQVIEVPRSLLQDFLKMHESDHVALYFLFGDAEDGSDQRVYVGQTGDLRARLISHNQKKDFWQRALVLISRTNSLTQTHALFLEWYCIQAAKRTQRYTVENGNSGSKPHTPAPLEADCLEIFETGRTLLSAIGYPLFEPVGASQETKADEVFYCRVNGSDGRGLYTPDGFIVLKGSIGRRPKATKSSSTNQSLRRRLLASGVISEDGSTVVFLKDHNTGSPSMAVRALLGRNSASWTEWKNKDGVTLNKLKRSAPEDDE